MLIIAPNAVDATISPVRMGSVLEDLAEDDIGWVWVWGLNFNPTNQHFYVPYGMLLEKGMLRLNELARSGFCPKCRRVHGKHETVLTKGKGRVESRKGHSKYVSHFSQRYLSFKGKLTRPTNHLSHNAQLINDVADFFRII